MTQELGNKVSCVISESQPQEKPRPREEKMTTDIVKGKLVTFDTEKCTEVISKLHLTRSGLGVRTSFTDVLFAPLAVTQYHKGYARLMCYTDQTQEKTKLLSIY